MKKMFMFVVILAVISVACGSVPMAQPAAPYVAPQQVYIAPTAVPVPTVDTHAMEMSYLDTQTAYFDNCSNASDSFSATLDLFDGSSAWQRMAIQSAEDEKYACATLGGYSNVPPKFAYLQSEIDAMRSDESIAMDCAILGIQNLDGDYLEQAITWLEKATVHLDNANAEIDRLVAQY
jgi:hypothetical protein